MRKRILPVLLTLLILIQPLPAMAAESAGLSNSVPVTVLDGPAVSAYGTDATAALAGEADLEVDGAAVLLLERNTGTMVYAKHIDDRREPASLTKLMTCLLALEQGDLEAEITVTDSALATMDPDGSSGGLLSGEVYTMETLLYCLMVESANDAALVIAEYIGGSQEGFVQMMNDRAAALGCTGTHFANPHGLHNDDHYTTARDIARILEATLEYEVFREIYSTDAYTVPATNQQEARTACTTNYLIDSDSGYYDPRVIGGKTGYTTPAGRCVACVAEDETRSYLAVVLGASGTDENGNTIYGSFAAATELFDFGFAQFTVCEALPEWTAVDKVPVSGGEKDATLITGSAATALLPVGYTPSLLSLGYALTGEPLTAPLAEDLTVGTVSVLYDGVCVGQVPLVTAAAVEALSPELQQIMDGEPSDVESAQDADTADTSRYRTVGLVLSVILGVALLGILILLFLILRASILRRRRRKRRRNSRPRR